MNISSMFCKLPPVFLAVELRQNWIETSLINVKRIIISCKHDSLYSLFKKYCQLVTKATSLYIDINAIATVDS